MSHSLIVYRTHRYLSTELRCVCVCVRGRGVGGDNDGLSLKIYWRATKNCLNLRSEYVLWLVGLEVDNYPDSNKCPFSRQFKIHNIFLQLILSFWSFVWFRFNRQSFRSLDMNNCSFLNSYQKSLYPKLWIPISMDIQFNRDMVVEKFYG